MEVTNGGCSTLAASGRRGVHQKDMAVGPAKGCDVWKR